MKKAEYIAKFGLEHYTAIRERAKAKEREAIKRRRKTDPEFAEECRRKVREYQHRRYSDPNDPWKDRVLQSRREALANNSELKNRKKKSDRYWHMNRYVKKGDLPLIENYSLALADGFIGWDIHHRLEFTINGEVAVNRDTLIRLDMYFNRPYFELIFLKHSDHTRIHMKVRNTE